MTRKLLSLATATAIVYVYLQSRLHSEDALFLVISSSPLVNLVLLAIAGLAVRLAFNNSFSSVVSYCFGLILAITLSVVGIAGLAYSSIDNYFGGLVKPLDYVVLLQLGVIFSLSLLSSGHPFIRFSLPMPKYSFPAPVRWKKLVVAYLSKPVVLPTRRTSGTNAI